MGDADLKSIVDVVSKVIDGAGVVVVVLGLLFATGAYALAQSAQTRRQTAYRVYRQQVGKAILLGLEFLVAADIIRTVAVAPNVRRRRSAGRRSRREDISQCRAGRRVVWKMALAIPPCALASLAYLDTRLAAPRPGVRQLWIAAAAGPTAVV